MTDRVAELEAEQKRVAAELRAARRDAVKAEKGRMAAAYQEAGIRLLGLAEATKSDQAAVVLEWLATTETSNALKELWAKAVTQQQSASAPPDVLPRDTAYTLGWPSDARLGDTGNLVEMTSGDGHGDTADPFGDVSAPAPARSY